MNFNISKHILSNLANNYAGLYVTFIFYSIWKVGILIQGHALYMYIDQSLNDIREKTNNSIYILNNF